MTFLEKKNIEIIVECNQDKIENTLKNIGNIKCYLPIINSYVVEIPYEQLDNLKNLNGIKTIYENTYITAQMNSSRNIINCQCAYDEGLTGKNITIAILDTGICPVDDFVKPRNRIIAFKDIINNKTKSYDDNGHGTHVAGIACGNGFMSNGLYKGIAYESNIVSIKVLDKNGKGDTAQVVSGIQWIIDNKKKYNIRIANLSIGSPTSDSQKDPLVKAVNYAWDHGIIMTIAAGNNGPQSSSITSPGVSKKVITVGGSNDSVDVTIWGNKYKNYSGRGPTAECIIKPDVVAPSSNIISCLSKTANNIDLDKIVDKNYLKLSGTSMATPMISGAIALLIQKYPHLSPNDVKYKLKFSTTDLGYSQNQQGWGLINIEKFISNNFTNEILPN